MSIYKGTITVDIPTRQTVTENEGTENETTSVQIVPQTSKFYPETEASQVVDLEAYLDNYVEENEIGAGSSSSSSETGSSYFLTTVNSQILDLATCRFNESDFLYFGVFNDKNNFYITNLANQKCHIHRDSTVNCFRNTISRAHVSLLRKFLMIRFSNSFIGGVNNPVESSYIETVSNMINDFNKLKTYLTTSNNRDYSSGSSGYVCYSFSNSFFVTLATKVYGFGSNSNNTYFSQPNSYYNITYPVKTNATNSSWPEPGELAALISSSSSLSSIRNSCWPIFQVSNKTLDFSPVTIQDTNNNKLTFYFTGSYQPILSASNIQTGTVCSNGVGLFVNFKYENSLRYFGDHLRQYASFCTFLHASADLNLGLPTIASSVPSFNILNSEDETLTVSIKNNRTALYSSNYYTISSNGTHPFGPAWYHLAFGKNFTVNYDMKNNIIRGYRAAAITLGVSWWRPNLYQFNSVSSTANYELTTTAIFFLPQYYQILDAVGKQYQPTLNFDYTNWTIEPDPSQTRVTDAMKYILEYLPIDFHFFYWCELMDTIDLTTWTGLEYIYYWGWQFSQSVTQTPTLPSVSSRTPYLRQVLFPTGQTLRGMAFCYMFDGQTNLETYGTNITWDFADVSSKAAAQNMFQNCTKLNTADHTHKFINVKTSVFTDEATFFSTLFGSSMTQACSLDITWV